MEMATKPQIVKLNILINNLQLKDEKKAILSEFTRGRTDSSKGLTFNEAKILIGRLCEFDPAERLKTIIARLAYQAGITYGDSDTDQLINKAKLNVFLKEKGTVKKDLQKQSYAELRRTHRQFEAILRKTEKSRESKAADKAVTELMKDLNLTSL